MERKKKTDDDVKTVVAPTKQSFAFEKYFGLRRKKKRGPKKKKKRGPKPKQPKKTTAKEQMIVNGGTLTQKKRAGLNAKLEACNSMPKTKR